MTIETINFKINAVKLTKFREILSKERIPENYFDIKNLAPGTIDKIQNVLDELREKMDISNSNLGITLSSMFRSKWTPKRYNRTLALEKRDIVERLEENGILYNVKYPPTLSYPYVVNVNKKNLDGLFDKINKKNRGEKGADQALLDMTKMNLDEKEREFIGRFGVFPQNKILNWRCSICGEFLTPINSKYRKIQGGKEILEYLEMFKDGKYVVCSNGHKNYFVINQKQLIFLSVVDSKNNKIRGLIVDKKREQR